MSEKVLNKFYFYATTLLTYSGLDRVFNSFICWVYFSARFLRLLSYHLLNPSPYHRYPLQEHILLLFLHLQVKELLQIGFHLSEIQSVVTLLLVDVKTEEEYVLAKGTYGMGMDLKGDMKGALKNALKSIPNK